MTQVTDPEYVNLLNILSESNCISKFVNAKILKKMLDKSFCLLLYLKKPKNYLKGPILIYLRITIDGVPKELSAKKL